MNIVLMDISCVIFAALSELKQKVRQLLITFLQDIIRSISLNFQIITLPLLFNSSGRDVLHGVNRTDYPNALSVLVIGLALDVAGIAFLIPANIHFNKSINLYNSNVKSVG